MWGKMQERNERQGKVVKNVQNGCSLLPPNRKVGTFALCCEIVTVIQEHFEKCDFFANI